MLASPTVSLQVAVFSYLIRVRLSANTWAVALATDRSGARTALWTVLSALYLWLGIMTPRPHKEERFLFVVYPILLLGAAYTLTEMGAALMTILLRCCTNEATTPAPAKASRRGCCGPRGAHLVVGAVLSAVVLAFVGLSMSRTTALIRYYGAPSTAYSSIFSHQNDKPTAMASTEPASVCVGKEWYRFPSSFFLHSSTRLRFVKSAFSGQLPQPFAAVNGTRTVLSGFNDENREEMSRYVRAASSHHPPSRARFVTRALS